MDTVREWIQFVCEYMLLLRVPTHPSLCANISKYLSWVNAVRASIHVVITFEIAPYNTHKIYVAHVCECHTCACGNTRLIHLWHVLLLKTRNVCMTQRVVMPPQSYVVVTIHVHDTHIWVSLRTGCHTYVTQTYECHTYMTTIYIWHIHVSVNL